MSTNTKEQTLQDIGRSQAAEIVRAVAALECDYDRLDLLKRHGTTDDEGAELVKLEEAAGECTSREDAETRITESALDVRMRGDWFAYGTEPADAAKPVEFFILLGTGGPASRIRGELQDGEVLRAWLEVQDWGTPWTEYMDIGRYTLLAFARCFYFGEG